MKELVKQNAKRFLDQWLFHLWPNAVDRYPNIFKWELLVDQLDRPGAQRLDAQHFVANVDPSERYTQSLPGTTKYRLRPDKTGFTHLFIAGDWTDCGLNFGCVEAAAISGRLASSAIQVIPTRDSFPGSSDQPAVAARRREQLDGATETRSRCLGQGRRRGSDGRRGGRRRTVLNIGIPFIRVDDFVNQSEDAVALGYRVLEQTMEEIKEGYKEAQAFNRKQEEFERQQQKFEAGEGAPARRADDPLGADGRPRSVPPEHRTRRGEGRDRDLFRLDQVGHEIDEKSRPDVGKEPRRRRHGSRAGRPGVRGSRRDQGKSGPTARPGRVADSP